MPCVLRPAAECAEGAGTAEWRAKARRSSLKGCAVGPQAQPQQRDLNGHHKRFVIQGRRGPPGPSRSRPAGSSHSPRPSARNGRPASLCTGVVLHAICIAVLTTWAYPASSASSCSPGTPSSPAHARGSQTHASRGATPHSCPSDHPPACCPRLTLAHARKSRFVSNARQFSMARYFSSQPDRRITLSTTCQPQTSPFSCLSPGFSSARRASHSHPRRPAAQT
jgi:hypothetical protein